MSKFIKRIQKAVKKTLDSVVVVGSDEKNMHSMVLGFNTVFLINYPHGLPKIKNIIAIQDLSFLNELHAIDIIFLNTHYNSETFQYMPNVIRKCTPVIFLHTNLVLSTEYIDFFNRNRYEQLSVCDDYQVWKIIRK